MTNEKYIPWYWSRKPNTFASAEDMASIVGIRPGPEWKLTRTTNTPGEPLTPDNFLWVTPNALTAAKEGRVEPPTFPVVDPKDSAYRTPKEQAVNDHRFHNSYIKGIADYAHNQKAKAERLRKIDDDLRTLIAHIEDYVKAKGFTAADALNPNVLSENAKLQAARQKVQNLMDEASGRLQKRKYLEALWERDRAMREERKLVNANNFVYTGKPGRPLKRFVQRKVKVADLSPAQREQYGVKPGEDFFLRPSPKLGRMFKIYTVEIQVPNPKLNAENQGQPD